MRNSRLVGIALCLLLPLALAMAAERPDFSGEWELNDDLSDDPREKLRESVKRRCAGGFMGPERPAIGGPGGDRGGFGGEPRRGGPESDPPPALRERLIRLERGVGAMTIRQSASRIDIVYADRSERRLYTDGRKQARQGGVGPIETRSAWNGDRLVVKIKTEQGRRITETWERPRGEERLHVNVALKGKGLRLEYTRVYDPGSAEPAGETETTE